MLIDLSCPAEVFQAVLPTEEIPAVSLLLFNLSDRIIASVEVTVRLFGGSGAEKDRVVYRARALNGRPHSTFSMTVPCETMNGVRRAGVTVDKVWFTDNAVWRRDVNSAVEYTPNDLPMSKGLTDLKYVAGENAVGYPSQQDGLWVCVCGRPNPDREEACLRCRQPKDLVFARFNPEAVEAQVNQRQRQLDLSTRSVREDTARLQRIREEEYNQAQARKAYRRRLLLALVTFGLLIAGILGAGIPALRVIGARHAMDAGSYSEAGSVLRELINFPGASAALAECDWQTAKAAVESASDPAELLAAASTLRAMAETREEAGALADEADLRRARLLLESGRRDAAWEVLSTLPAEDERRIALENDCLFDEAKEELEKKDYLRARELLLALGNYPGAGELAMECIYRPAMELMGQGQYEEVIAELSRIPDYRDSRERVLECHYRMADLYALEGDLEHAASEYMLAGSFADAAEKTRQTVYLQAEAALEEERLEDAQALYASIPGYADADTKRTQCLWTLVQQAMKDKEYVRALTLMEGLPANFADLAETRRQASYQAGLAAIRRKDWQSAVQYLEAAGNERDAESQLGLALEELAVETLAAGDGEAALALIERIPDRKNYSKLKKQAEYRIAVSRAEAGEDPAECLERFTALGNYEDAEDWARRMHYALGEAAESRGEILAAAAEFEKAGNWQDAAARAESLYDRYYGERVTAAKEAMEQEQYALAVTLLETLQTGQLPAKYKNVPALYEEACVEAGKQLYQAGKPYEALAFFRLVPQNKRAQNFMNNSCYLILGTWVDRDGNVLAEFREDSTCILEGETLNFRLADSYTLKTAPAGEEPETTHRISTLNAGRLTLRDMRSGREKTLNLYRQGREAEAEAETEEESVPDEEAQQGEEEYMVRE